MGAANEKEIRSEMDSSKVAAGVDLSGFWSTEQLVT